MSTTEPSSRGIPSESVRVAAVGAVGSGLVQLGTSRILRVLRDLRDLAGTGGHGSRPRSTSGP